MSGLKAKLFAAVLAALTVTGVFIAHERGATPSQVRDSTGTSSEQLPPLIRSMEGPDLFRAYCAPCHGIDGKGHGPAAVALKSHPADLTALARNNHGQFPLDLVRTTITGEKVLASHGSREMPIWGPVFHQVEADVDRGHVRMDNLVKYLESIQDINTGASKPKPISQTFGAGGISGAKLFQQNCAVCHATGVNAPEVPSPFRTPPDLATLAQRHGGKFPEAYVSDILRSGIAMPAHGPAEMPI
jgi:mono/diheme cytochrome c family protein